LKNDFSGIGDSNITPYGSWKESPPQLISGNISGVGTIRIATPAVANAPVYISGAVTDSGSGSNKINTSIQSCAELWVTDSSCQPR